MLKHIAFTTHWAGTPPVKITPTVVWTWTNAPSAQTIATPAQVAPIPMVASPVLVSPAMLATGLAARTKYVRIIPVPMAAGAVPVTRDTLAPLPGTMQTTRGVVHAVTSMSVMVQMNVAKIVTTPLAAILAVAIPAIK